MQTFGTLVILCTACAYLSPFVNPASFRWFSYFGTSYPWWALLNIGFLVFWITRLNRFALYHFTILLLGAPHFNRFFAFNKGDINAAQERHITLVTHNLGLLFKNHSAQKADSLARAYAAFLSENGKPDIVCTQETKGVFYPLLGKYLGYDQRFNLKKGTVILSRYPILAGGDIPFGKTGNSTLWADIRLPSGKIARVYNVHLQSNKVSQDADKIMDGNQDLDDLSKVMDKVGGATSTRAEQAKRLRTHILEAPHPVIVCGDFNDTPNSYVYREISGGLTDTFEAAGWGLGTTYAGHIPLLRIDYILSDPGLQPLVCQVQRDSRWSDHYPVFSTLLTP